MSLMCLLIPLAWGALWWVCCPPPCAQVSVWDRLESWHLLSPSSALQMIRTLKIAKLRDQHNIWTCFSVWRHMYEQGCLTCGGHCVVEWPFRGHPGWAVARWMVVWTSGAHSMHIGSTLIPPWPVENNTQSYENKHFTSIYDVASSLVDWLESSVLLSWKATNTHGQRGLRHSASKHRLFVPSFLNIIGGARCQYDLLRPSVHIWE